MKWLFTCLAIFVMVAPAMAGQDPYIAIVGNDCVPGEINIDTGACIQTTHTATSPKPFYFSPKHRRFMYDQTDDLFSVDVCSIGAPQFATSGLYSAQFARVGGCVGGTSPGQACIIGTANNCPGGGTCTLNGCEAFLAQGPLNQVEVCDVSGTTSFTTGGLKNAVTTAGSKGFYEWWIRLPKAPAGEINIVIECGILKPNALPIFRRPVGQVQPAIELCAAETGERVGPGCSHLETDPDLNPIVNTALPMITAIAYPGPFSSFTPFHLTAFKNPGTYNMQVLNPADCLLNGGSSCDIIDDFAPFATQVLDGSANAKILLKACMDKTIVAKLPVSGQGNTLSASTGEVENDLAAGDIIQVRMDIPRQNTVDIYCHANSARLAGVGEAP